MRTVFDQIEDVMLKQYLQDIARIASASKWTIFIDFFATAPRRNSFPSILNKLINDSIEEIEGGVLVATIEDDYENHGSLRLKIAKKVIASISDGRSENWEEFHSLFLSKLYKFSTKCDRCSFQPSALLITNRWEKIGRLLSKLQQSVEYIYESDATTLTNLQDLRKELLDFYKSINQYLSYSILDDFKFSAEGNYGEATHIKRLFIYTSDRPNLADMGLDYIAISNLYYAVYNILMHANKNSLYDNKGMAILDARFGSTIIDILGLGKVVDLVEKLLTGSVNFFREKYDTQKKIAEIPTDLASLDKILELRAKLHEQGLDTAHLDVLLEDSASVIAVNLNILLKKKSNIAINNKLLSLGKDKHSLEEGNPSKLIIPISLKKEN